ncbi:unnamed protein product [Heterobilharzia americana]|nr:unnamed protein product [Heterobilharzia americana]
MNFNNKLVEDISQLLSPLITEDELKHLEGLSQRPVSTKTSVNPSIFKHAESEVLRLFHKQEYFRKAYNDTLDRMNNLANILPSYSLDHIQTSLYPEEAPNGTDDEESVSLDPEYVNFMMETIRHRQTRDITQRNSHDLQSMLRAPPRKADKSADVQTVYSQIEMLEASLLHYYEFLSPCRDSPIWPVLPLKRNL